MRRLEAEIQIGVPAENVWEILMDLESYKEWNPFVREITGEIKVGNTIGGQASKVSVEPFEEPGRAIQNRGFCRDHEAVRWVS